MNATWGRFDQTMGNLNTIFSVQSSLPVYLLSEDSLMFVLEPVRCCYPAWYPLPYMHMLSYCIALSPACITVERVNVGDKANVQIFIFSRNRPAF